MKMASTAASGEAIFVSGLWSSALGLFLWRGWQQSINIQNLVARDIDLAVRHGRRQVITAPIVGPRAGHGVVEQAHPSAFFVRGEGVERNVGLRGGKRSGHCPDNRIVLSVRRDAGVEAGRILQ